MCGGISQNETHAKGKDSARADCRGSAVGHGTNQEIPRQLLGTGTKTSAGISMAGSGNDDPGVQPGSGKGGILNMVLAEPIRITSRITGALDRLGIPYLIGGSLASSLHGIPRSTHDVDIVADIRENHIPEFAKALESGFYIR